MTLREEIAALSEKGYRCTEIIQIIRRDKPATKPHRIRELYAAVLGPEAMAREAEELAKPRAEDAPVGFVLESESGIKRIYKEITVGVQGTESQREGVGGLRKVLISLPHVAWMDREEI